MLGNSISPSSLVSFPVSLSFSLSEGEDAYPDVRYIAQLEQTLAHGGSSGDYVVDKHYVFPPDSFCRDERESAAHILLPLHCCQPCLAFAERFARQQCLAYIEMEHCRYADA